MQKGRTRTHRDTDLVDKW